MTRALKSGLQLAVPATVFAAWVLAGAAIFVSPEQFYELTPGVSQFGPLNAHFIHDVALVYVASGLIGPYALRTANVLRCAAAALWSCRHGVFHLHLWIHRGFPFDGIFLFDLGFVIVPPYVVLAQAALGWTRPTSTE